MRKLYIKVEGAPLLARVEHNVKRRLIGVTYRAQKESDDRRDDDLAANDTSVRSLELAGR